MLLRLELHITWHHKCCKGSTIRLGTVIERYCHSSTCVTADAPTPKLAGRRSLELWCTVLHVYPCFSVSSQIVLDFQNAHHRTDLLVCKGKETLAQDSRTKRYWDASRFCIETQDDTRTYKNTSNKWCAMCTTCRDHGPIIAMMRVLKSSLVLRSQKHPADFQKTFRQVIMFVLLCGYPPFFGDSDAEVLAKALGITVKPTLERCQKAGQSIHQNVEDYTLFERNPVLKYPNWMGYICRGSSWLILSIFLLNTE